MNDALSFYRTSSSSDYTGISRIPEQHAGSSTHFQTVPPELKLQICRLVSLRCLPALALVHPSWSSVAQDVLLACISLTLWNDGKKRHADERAAGIRLLCSLRDSPEKALRVRSFRVTFNDRQGDEAIPVTEDDWRLYVDTLKQLRRVRHIRLPFTDPVERLDEVVEMIAKCKLPLCSIELAGLLYKRGHMDESPFTMRLAAALDTCVHQGTLRAIVAERAIEGDAGSNDSRFLENTGDSASSLGYSPEDGTLSFYASPYEPKYWKIFFERSFVVLPYLYDNPRQDVTAVRIYFSPKHFAQGLAGQLTSLIAERFPNVTDVTFALDGNYYYGSDPDEDAKIGHALLKATALGPALAPFSGRLQSLFKLALALMSQPSKYLALAHAYLSAMQALDVSALSPLLAPTVRAQVLPSAPLVPFGLAEPKDKEGLLGVVTYMKDNVLKDGRLPMEIIEVTDASASGLVVIHTIAKDAFTRSGKPFANEYLMMLWMDASEEGGELTITRMQEFVDSSFIVGVLAESASS
ncbi:hypothetical protein EXIGLDRAFT_831232 [Exidia glandulosa HHB12029]|uniref:F-box domain-containing protein n=1 Tax=Exidia glandulosa HHB12029 TaxID=1314781 RepID=A0A166BBH0_EXIGL|nr:hypothetical protein EXIGLDRAFT_831232 [Exidia glandulosa HHB12029]